MKRFFRKKRNRVIFICTLLLIAIGVGAALYFLQPKEEKKPVKKKKPKKQIVEKLKIVDEDSNKRPIAIMIDNNVGSYAHKGLQDAYITYEIIVEGGLSRIMAIYKDRDTAEIGPVRSSRHYFLDYALESDTIYTHFGWSPFAEKDVKALGVNNLNGLYDSAPFWRVSDYKAPHNVFTSIEKVYAAAKQKGYATETSDWKLLNYSIKKVNLNESYPEDTNIIQANSVSFNFSPTQVRGFTYSTEGEYYLRSMNNAPHTDATTKEQYHYKNIILIKAANYTLDNQGRQDVNTTGTGDGFYLTNGYAIPIKWTKGARNSKTRFTYNEEEIKINDGNTMIEVVPTNNNIVIA